jgi:ERCC4-type nuclease
MLVIDSREPHEVIDAVRPVFEAAGIAVQVRALEFGDFLMTPNNHKILVERKTPTDFINSTNPTSKDPATKLARQLNGCLSSGVDVVVLLIDGAYFPVRGGKIRTTKMVVHHDFGAFASKIRTVQRNGIRVEHNMSEWFLPYFLLSMYKNEMKDHHDTLVLSPKSFKVPTKKETRWVLLMGIRGVGPSLAQALLTHFKSITGVALATEEELRQVKGVGKKLAEQIRWYMGE